MRRLGQATTEYMLIISVISIAIAAVLITFETILIDNTDSLSTQLTTTLTSSGAQ